MKISKRIAKITKHLELLTDELSTESGLSQEQATCLNESFYAVRNNDICNSADSSEAVAAKWQLDLSDVLRIRSDAAE